MQVVTFKLCSHPLPRQKPPGASGSISSFFSWQQRPLSPSCLGPVGFTLSSGQGSRPTSPGRCSQLRPQPLVLNIRAPGSLPGHLAPFPARSPDPNAQWPHFMTHMELSPLGYKSLRAGTSLAHSRLHLQVPGRRSQVSAHSQHLPSCFQGARAFPAPPNALHLDHLHVLSVAPRPPCPDSSHPLPSHVLHCPPRYLRAMCTSWDVPSLLLSLSLCTCCFGLECPPSRYLLDSRHSLCPHLCRKSLLFKKQTLWSPLPICPYPFIFLW